MALLQEGLEAVLLPVKPLGQGPLLPKGQVQVKGRLQEVHEPPGLQDALPQGLGEALGPGPGVFEEEAQAFVNVSFH